MNWIPNDAPRARWLAATLWFGDIACALAALLLADGLRRALPLGAPADRFYVTPNVLGIVALIWSAVFYFLGTYERRQREEWRVEMRAVFLASTFALFTLAAAFYFFKIENFSRVLFIYFYALAILFALTWRLAARALRARGRVAAETRRALILGADAKAQELAAQIQSWPEFTLLGFIAQAETAADDLPAPLLGTLADTLRIVDRENVGDVFLSQTTRGRAELAELILALRERRVRVRLMPDLLEVVTVRTGIETLRGMPLITLREPAITGMNAVLKRAFDLSGASLCLLLASPLMLLIAALIRLDSKGPILFAQERAGRYGKPFRMYKFRSMVENAEYLLDSLVQIDELEHPQFKLRNDPRVTRIGAWLRRTSLDELPQFFNVLGGSMSLVGPRPEVMRLAARYSSVERQCLLVKPGMTGAMQTSGRGDLAFEERMKLEMDYIENYSLWRDVTILIKTVPAVLSGRGAY